MKAWSTDGLDSLLSTVQMPAGIPVGTLAIGKAGAINAALLAVSIMSLSDAELRGRYIAYRQAQTEAVLATELPPAGSA
jgi:5-(carboxyamino)imidazole ribonucleotide mutase